MLDVWWGQSSRRDERWPTCRENHTKGPDGKTPGKRSRQRWPDGRGGVMMELLYQHVMPLFLVFCDITHELTHYCNDNLIGIKLLLVWSQEHPLWHNLHFYWRFCWLHPVTLLFFFSKQVWQVKIWSLKYLYVHLAGESVFVPLKSYFPCDHITHRLWEK